MFYFLYFIYFSIFVLTLNTPTFVTWWLSHAFHVGCINIYSQEKETIP